ncbi:hypothetical protein BKA93DRAFT_753852 [Sparassis latifolia]
MKFPRPTAGEEAGTKTLDHLVTAVHASGRLRIVARTVANHSSVCGKSSGGKRDGPLLQPSTVSYHCTAQYEKSRKSDHHEAPTTSRKITNQLGRSSYLPGGFDQQKQLEHRNAGRLVTFTAAAITGESAVRCETAIDPALLDIITAAAWSPWESRAHFRTAINDIL